MRELKRLFLGALVLTYVGGIGTGAWVGNLAAAPNAPHIDPDRRVQAFQEAFELDPSQVRQLRTIFAQHQSAVESIEKRMTARQLMEKLDLERKTRERIRLEVMTEAQRTEYDNLRKRQ